LTRNISRSNKELRPGKFAHRSELRVRFHLWERKKKESERKYREKGQSRRGRTLCYQMPPRRIQRVIRAPGNIRAVCSTRAILVDIRGAKLGLPVQAGERVYVTPPPVSMWSVISVHSALELAYYTHVCASRMSNVYEGSDPKINVRIIGATMTLTYGRVNFVHTKTGIQICERCDRWSYPGRRERCNSANVRRIVGVENLHLSRISE
jgi:hypothetical protein